MNRKTTRKQGAVATPSRTRQRRREASKRENSRKEAKRRGPAARTRPALIVATDRATTGDCPACGGLASNADCRLLGEVFETVRGGLPLLGQRYEFRCPHCGHAERHLMLVQDHRPERKKERKP